MIGVGILALIANIACLALISRSRGGGVHVKASYIFSANDVMNQELAGRVQRGADDRGEERTAFYSAVVHEGASIM